MLRRSRQKGRSEKHIAGNSAIIVLKNKYVILFLFSVENCIICGVGGKKKNRQGKPKKIQKEYRR